MSSIADRVRIAQDKDGMLRRALERIIQLYTDRSHFVYELLQNAEDAEATCIKFVQYLDKLEVMHDGRPFTTENLQGLCDIGKSDKVDNLNQIGEFGVGFKSVFGICDKVKLYSDPSNFREKTDAAVPFSVEIVDFTKPVDIPSVELDWPYTTKFVFPYTVGRTFSGFKSVAELNTTLSKKLQNLGITTLLFMKNLEVIEYRVEVDSAPIEGQYLLEKKEINDHCSLVSAYGHSDAVKEKKEVSEEISYLLFSKKIDAGANRSVDIAFPVVVKDNGEYECKKPKDPFVSVYFPTETESKLGFIVQGPYRTTPNRSSIPADEPDNIKLAEETAVLLTSALRELRDSKKLNMSFLKAMPFNERRFDSFPLFYPVYEAVKSLFQTAAIIPCKKQGHYVAAKRARIARQERLASLLNSQLLTSLINDGTFYHWLPTFLTETNREYEAVYKYLTSELKIPVIRPEDLRVYFASNPSFLPERNNDWLVELYSILENVTAAFAKTRGEANLLVSEIIKTSTGKFVAAYRRTDNKQYIPNVFLMSNKVQSDDINYVDPAIYAKCRHFFDDVLQIQKPNEYEFFVKDIKKRYGDDAYQDLDMETHILDAQRLHKYLNYEEYHDEIARIIRETFVVRCADGRMRNAFMARVFLPATSTGISIEGYLKNIVPNVSFVDLDFYMTHRVPPEMLCALGVKDSILYGDSTVQGQYYTGMGGRQPDWWTAGDFRWKLTIDYLKDAIKYISAHPAAKDAIIKSKTIFSILMENESKLQGTVRIGGSTPNLVDEPCEMIRVLRGERTFGWDGKWLYTESLELVAPKSISKHDISTSIYGKIKPDSIVYELLGFQKTEADEVDDLKKTIPQSKLDAFFENELRQRFGLSSAQLTERFGSVSAQPSPAPSYEIGYEFPTVRVKNWETLRKHAAEMLCFADPVRYEYAVRKIRVSNRPKEARAYLLNMYRYDGVYKYACQMCHDSSANIEVVQLFNEPEVELDPVNLCLCPNCAARYRKMRGNSTEMQYLRERILKLTENEITKEDHVVLDIEDQQLWFTQIHLAEIQALLKLADDVHAGAAKKAGVVADAESNEKAGLSVYAGYIGKIIKRKTGFEAKIINVDSEWLYVKIIKSKDKKPGDETKIQLSFVLSRPDVYQIL